MDNKSEKPSCYTFLYWLIQDNKIDPDLFFNFLEVFWPTFINKNGYVFLKEQYSEEKFNTLINENANPEYWINLLTVDDFFFQKEDGEEKSVILTQELVKTWEAKLKKEFPLISFTIECVRDEEYGDCGLTFYQNKKKSC